MVRRLRAATIFVAWSLLECLWAVMPMRGTTPLLAPRVTHQWAPPTSPPCDFDALRG